MAKTLQLFISKRATEVVTEFIKDPKKLHAAIQKHISQLTKITDSILESNEIKDHQGKIIPLADLKLLEITDNIDWKPLEKESTLTEPFPHSLRDATYAALTEYAQIQIAYLIYQNSQQKDKKLHAPIPSCLQEVLQRDLGPVVMREIYAAKELEILGEYDVKPEPIPIAQR